jgi:hypothetical protein
MRVYRSSPASSAFALTWQLQPAALLAWGLIVTLMLSVAIGIDRTFIIDQANYVNNFAWDPSLEWADDLIPQGFTLKSLIVGVFSEEVLWHLWTTLLGSLLEPTTAVIVTVCVLNLLIALSVVRLPDPMLPLVIWLLLPVGFIVTGLSVLRQGFALAVMLYIALRLNRPVLGTLLAAMIHTTFALAVPFAIVGWVCSRRPFLGPVIAVSLGFAAAFVGAMLFEAFGGRRLKTYSVSESDATSILYVIGALLCSLPSVLRLLSVTSSGEPVPLNRTLANLAVIHVGVIAFVATSFFIFPLGTGRVGYLSMLLLMPILPTVRRRDDWVGMLIFWLLVLYLVYLAVKAYLDGAYDIYL